MQVNASKTQKKASLHTHGCRLNQYETKLIRDHLESRGYEIVPFGDKADLGIINTCTVTREADAKCRQSIRSFIKKNPGAFTAVVGCYSQSGYKEIAGIEGVDLIVGNQDKLGVLDYIDDVKNEVPVIVRERISKEDFTISFVGDMPFTQRANLKIQDGCDFMCTFCTIPFVRGRARSRDFSNLMEEARSLAGRGVRELVLTGVNIGTFSSSGETILTLVDALNDVSGIDRVRISSIEPTTIPVELFERMADINHVLLPYLHIPLQSGSDTILKAMRRKYTRTEFLDFIERAYASVPDICIGTDILVGFPGEAETDFEASCQLLLESPLAYSHVFTYSERDGTVAAKETGHIPMPERHERSNRLRRLSAKKRHDYYANYLGKTVDVLFENPREGLWPGYTDNYIRVVVDCPERDLTNFIGKVRLERISADFVEGMLVGVEGSQSV
ncbi:MAG TPA: tRNA (N(6)-L-threonylcarbamoyladenosine(37)-C(2))-methylthiotransferase MtaB [Opitutae bacterium]|nr:tRNA (N(6)-L-threonylcarbamoyladenosine(37)-C(2))-methylthiotransferase MtaB [Opitutae bacterium]